MSRKEGVKVQQWLWAQVVQLQNVRKSLIIISLSYSFCPEVVSNPQSQLEANWDWQHQGF